MLVNKYKTNKNLFMIYTYIYLEESVCPSTNINLNIYTYNI